MLPTLFVSHGSPQVLIEDSAARDFLRGFAATMPKPRAIVIASAHFGTHRPAVVGDAKPGMIYDFGGMPELHQLVYPAPGDPVAAMKVAGLLQAAGLAPVMATGHGYDHGTWVPLMLLYPDADIPVIQLSVQPRLDPAHHLAVGRALASLKEEDILVIGSGSATHNLRSSTTARIRLTVRRCPGSRPLPTGCMRRSLPVRSTSFCIIESARRMRSRTIRPMSISCRCSLGSARGMARRAGACIRAPAAV